MDNLLLKLDVNWCLSLNYNNLEKKDHYNNHFNVLTNSAVTHNHHKLFLDFEISCTEQVMSQLFFSKCMGGRRRSSSDQLSTWKWQSWHFQWFRKRKVWEFHKWTVSDLHANRWILISPISKAITLFVLGMRWDSTLKVVWLHRKNYLHQQ